MSERAAGYRTISRDEPDGSHLIAVVKDTGVIDPAADNEVLDHVAAADTAHRRRVNGDARPADPAS
ncbi:hypothetical protein ACJWDR_37650 [Streptomyces tauricus]|uniref:hypothetical protein n=1 Tax=Streptomyces tauricus TaxID=68274 RepID=UPI00387F1F09